MHGAIFGLLQSIPPRVSPFEPFRAVDSQSPSLFDTSERVSSDEKLSNENPVLGSGFRSDPSGWSSSRKILSECRPLLDAATIGIFRNNAFRVTGLPVDATTREIRKQGDKLKMMEELGQGQTMHASVFAIRPPPTVYQIRDALRRLEDPETRLVEEFFWFWPQQFGQREMDSAIQALLSGDCETASKIWTVRESSHTNGTVAMHNSAILWHLTALEREHYTADTEIDKAQHAATEVSWRNAIRRWRYLLADDLLWKAVAVRILELDDPRISTDFCRQMRVAMPLALAKIHAQLALTYAERKRLDLAKVQVELLRELTPDVVILEIAADLALAAAKLRLAEHTKSVKSEADRRPEAADALAHALIAPTLFLMEVVELFFGETGNAGRDALDETVSVCVDCAVAYQRSTGNNEIFVNLLERLRPLTADDELCKRITNNLRVGKQNVENALASKLAKDKALNAPASHKHKAAQTSANKKPWFTRIKGKLGFK